ncbi:MAG: aconitate hydratase, partial [Oligoflexia bacterium]|nr:aconitate hydratase [Oligoflexia bacterium]
KISDNLLLGAVNDWTGETGRVENIFTKQTASFSEVARNYKKRGQAWMIVGCDNYGEGSSREHAAMTPRWLGAKVVLVKSFARIHETNLKKQGILPLCFVNPEDASKFLPEDRVSLTQLNQLSPKSQHPVVIEHKDGSKDEILVKHSLNADQIKWFKAGSSLNTLK